jgi:hypothetical protein
LKLFKGELGDTLYGRNPEERIECDCVGVCEVVGGEDTILVVYTGKDGVLIEMDGVGVFDIDEDGKEIGIPDIVASCVK